MQIVLSKNRANEIMRKLFRWHIVYAWWTRDWVPMQASINIEKQLAIVVSQCISRDLWNGSHIS